MAARLVRPNRAAAEQPLELAADLHGKRWRADLAGFGDAAEMPMNSAAASKQLGARRFHLVGVAVVLTNAYLAERKVKPPERATQRANS